MFKLKYHPKVVDELNALPDILRGKMFRLLDMLEEHGNVLRYPLSKPVRDGLFELRTSGTDTARTLYAFKERKHIYILRCFVKKTDKIAQREITISRQRLEDISDE